MENLKCLFTNFPWDILFFWLLPLLLLWWFMNREVSKWKNKSTEMHNRITFLEGELEACRKLKAPVVPDASATNVTTGIAAGIAPPLTQSAKDDLKIVEGIGPKIEGLFNKAGIYTFAELASTPVSRMKEILEKEGSRFQIHDPGTWAEQAALARDGKWDELKKWQDELYKGRR